MCFVSVFISLFHIQFQNVHVLVFSELCYCCWLGCCMLLFRFFFAGLLAKFCVVSLHEKRIWWLLLLLHLYFVSFFFYIFFCPSFLFRFKKTYREHTDNSIIFQMLYCNIPFRNTLSRFAFTIIYYRLFYSWRMRLFFSLSFFIIFMLLVFLSTLHF